MALYTLLIKDMRNKVFQRMNDINQARNDHFSKNVVSMVNANMLIQIEEINFRDDTIFLEKRGWTNDQALYDKLLMEYSAKTGKFLIGWVQ